MLEKPSVCLHGGMECTTWVARRWFEDMDVGVEVWTDGGGDGRHRLSSRLGHTGGQGGCETVGSDRKRLV